MSREKDRRRPNTFFLLPSFFLSPPHPLLSLLLLHLNLFLSPPGRRRSSEGIRFDSVRLRLVAAWLPSSRFPRLAVAARCAPRHPACPLFLHRAAFRSDFPCDFCLRRRRKEVPRPSSASDNPKPPSLVYSCCIGNLSKSQPVPAFKPKTSVRKRPHHSSTRKRRQCSSGLEAMENNVSVSVSLEGNISSLPNSIINDSNGKDTSFINHAAIAWAEMRRQWTGDQEKVPKETSREPIISWSTTYDDLLSTSERFQQPIPLSEMVDFLVDIWHEEGLYD
uniref:Gag1-like clamp domain-containing protein n=1 Tax=Leersia perrieri TaxID=77586 RepID=A0A0D9WYS5_9ORYZ